MFIMVKEHMSPGGTVGLTELCGTEEWDLPFSFVYTVNTFQRDQLIVLLAFLYRIVPAIFWVNPQFAMLQTNEKTISKAPKRNSQKRIQFLTHLTCGFDQ